MPFGEGLCEKFGDFGVKRGLGMIYVGRYSRGNMWVLMDFYRNECGERFRQRFNEL